MKPNIGFRSLVRLFGDDTDYQLEAAALSLSESHTISCSMKDPHIVIDYIVDFTENVNGDVRVWQRGREPEWGKENSDQDGIFNGCVVMLLLPCDWKFC